MKPLILLFLFSVLLLSGCMGMRTAEDCESFKAEDVVSQTAWGENLIKTDEGVVMKANVTCWHSAALSYAAWGDMMNATNSCERIKSVSLDPDDKDTLYEEYVLCIGAVAKRFREPTICQKIDDSEYAYHKSSCMRNATPPPAICGGPIFALLALGASMFFRKQRGV